MQSIRAIIVDDEPPARKRLARLLAEADVPVEVVGEAVNGSDALEQIDALAPDVVFLDIRMPLLDGFDVVELLKPPRPQIVFVTAYDEHAIRAFEVNALDYLTKPVRLGRLNASLERLADAQARRRSEHAIDELLRERSAPPLARLTVRAGRRLRVVALEDVRWLEAREKVVFAHLADGAHLVEFTLDDLERRLDARAFIRVHRSYIINAAFVKELVPWFGGRYMARFADGAELPVARRRVRDVRRLLGGE